MGESQHALKNRAAHRRCLAFTHLLPQTTWLWPRGSENLSTEKSCYFSSSVPQASLRITAQLEVHNSLPY